VRERIALWEGGKAALLDEIMGRKDAIDDSDQGRSFRAFWDFLMSDSRQQELTSLLDTILEHPAVAATEPDPRLRRVHYDWLQAGDHTQRTVADLSKQLRRFLDDQAWLENRRIMDLLRGIEAKSLAVRESATDRSRVHGNARDIRHHRAALRAPAVLAALQALAGFRHPHGIRRGIDASALFAVRLVDKAALASHIRHSLRDASQVTLRQLVQSRPPEHGLAEIIAYLELAHTSFTITVDESAEDVLEWSCITEDGSSIQKSARLPRVIFVR
jgi:hypothetical protein